MARKNKIAIVLVIGLALSGCNPFPTRSPCNLPRLVTDLELEVMDKISTNSYFSHECSVEIAQEFIIKRNWGVIKMKWWGSPHRLWMEALSSNNETLNITGISVKNAPKASSLGNYSIVRTFSGQSYVDDDVSKTFTLNVHSPDNRILEEMTFGYETEKCTCASYDAI